MDDKGRYKSIKMKDIILIVLVFSFVSCGNKNVGSQPPPPSPAPDITTYTNPVFKPILADPTVIKDPASEYFYAYGTEDHWTTDNKNHLVAIVRSKDLVNWTYVGDAFTTKPVWKTNGGIWAPDINPINNQYYLYYSYSVWADPNPGIGLAISSSPAGPFIDQGKIFFSSDVGMSNAIDPFYFEDGGNKYLFAGSYSSLPNAGIYGLVLSADGKTVPDTSAKFKITAGDFEGAIIHKRDNYYYFIGSKNNCCDGASSVYQLRVGRSRDLKGPYLDKNGNDLKNPGSGTLILQRNSIFAGPGHNARIIKDKEGTDWMLYHAMDIKNAVINGVNQRALMLDKVNWGADGWPLVNDGAPSATKQIKPVF